MKKVLPQVNLSAPPALLLGMNKPSELYRHLIYRRAGRRDLRALLAPYAVPQQRDPGQGRRWP